ncbi:MAG: tetraprenyl-beta-curcumene synthase family protein, partial [Bacillota bacterium]
MNRYGRNNEAPWGAVCLARAMAFHMIPLVDRELAKWVGLLERCPDPELKKQGLTSIRHKRFHAIGGSVYGLDPRPRFGLISLIVAYQTISDYLDNLCDRAGVEDERAFRRLHQAMLDAVTPVSENAGQGGPGELDYYAFYPHKSDGGYLRALVTECRRQISFLPSYGATRDTVERFARLYGDLQVYKHVHKQDRVPVLTRWFEREWRRSDDVYWWEFAAACGSTLGVFALLNLAARQDSNADLTMEISSAYFPWICGLHILLDYLIDQSEDLREGDLNFVSFYRDPGVSARRLDHFLEKALRGASDLPCAEFHQGVVKGLLALYLSDPKVEAGALGAIAAPLLERAGPDARAMWRACRFLR